MSLLKASLVGLGAGCAYGAGWAVLALVTGYEYQYATVGFGCVVGAAVSVAAGREGGSRAGLLAVLATLGTALAARLVVVDRLVVEDRAVAGEMIEEISDDEALVYLAIAEAVTAEDSGRRIAWPMGVTIDTADEAIDFPPEIWSAAVSRWRGFSAADQDQVRGLIRDTVRAALSGGRAEELDAAFTGSFGSDAVAALVVACIMAFFMGRAQWDGTGDGTEDTGASDADGAGADAGEGARADDAEDDPGSEESNDVG